MLVYVVFVLKKKGSNKSTLTAVQRGMSLRRFGVS